MLARVRHENVVTVFGADIVDGVAGLWMELIHGPTLAQIVTDEGPMAPRDAALVVNKVIGRRAIPGSPNVRSPLNLERLAGALDHDLESLGPTLSRKALPRRVRSGMSTTRAT